MSVLCGIHRVCPPSGARASPAGEFPEAPSSRGGLGAAWADCPREAGRALSGASVRLRPHGLKAAACCQTWSPDTTFTATRCTFGDPFLRVKRVIIPRDWSLSAVAEVLPAGSLFHLSCNRRSHARREAASFFGHSFVRSLVLWFGAWRVFLLPAAKPLGAEVTVYSSPHLPQRQLTLSTRSCSLGVCSKLTFLNGVCAYARVR